MNKFIFKLLFGCFVCVIFFTSCERYPVSALLGLSDPAQANNNKLTVYPNPWIPESGKSLDDKTGDQMKQGSYTADGWIKFRGINKKKDNNCHGVLKIYDVAGHLVREKFWTIQEEKNIPLPQTHKEDRDRTVHWDGKNNDCEYVESGEYTWIIEENDGSKYDGKIVVIR